MAFHIIKCILLPLLLQVFHASGPPAWALALQVNQSHTHHHDHLINLQRAQAGATSDAEVAVLANATAAAAAEAAEAADAAAAAAAQAQLWEDDQGLDGGHPAAPKSAEALARELQVNRIHSCMRGQMDVRVSCDALRPRTYALERPEEHGIVGFRQMCCVIGRNFNTSHSSPASALS
eukprot:scaffold192976_cov18-Tisochrysis_lutea.AAC.1